MIILKHEKESSASPLAALKQVETTHFYIFRHEFSQNLETYHDNATVVFVSWPSEF